uniref:Uncharacterized protein n=1 Tax=Oryza barthii TaxID=65489 RepID=A0A0D3FIB9_9ORYZ
MGTGMLPRRAGRGRGRRRYRGRVWRLGSASMVPRRSTSAASAAVAALSLSRRRRNTYGSPTTLTRKASIYLGWRSVSCTRRNITATRSSISRCSRLNRYFVAVVVDGEMVLNANNMAEGAYRKTKRAARPQPRYRPHLPAPMSVTVDGKRVLHIRCLRWKFRDTEKVDLSGGDGV